MAEPCRPQLEQRSGFLETVVRVIPRLRGWSRTGEEDLHQSPGTLLPVRGGCHVGDADKSPKQIEWVEVLPYVPAFDCALHQGIDRSLDLGTGTLIELRGTSDERIQRRGDDLLSRYVVNEQKHPCAQRFNRGHGVGELPLCCRQLFHFRLINRLNQRIAAWEVAIQSPRSDTRLFGDVVQTGVGAVTGEFLPGPFQNAPRC